MRFLLLHICFFLLLPATNSLWAQETRLNYDLEDGRTYGLDIRIQQTTSYEAANSAEINISSTWKIDFFLDSVDASGTMFMEVSYRKLHFAMLAPGMGLDMNSSDNQSPALRSMMDTLENNSFHLSMSPSGQLLEMWGLERIMNKLSECPARDSLEKELLMQSLDEAYGPNAFRGIFMLFVSYFPAVQPIKNWTQDMIYYFNTKPVKMVNRYQHAKTSDELIIIQGLGMLNSMEPAKEKLKLGLVESSLSGSQTFDFQVDRRSGWLKECLSRQRVRVEATVVESKSLPKGLKIPSYTETLFEVQGRITP